MCFYSDSFIEIYILIRDLLNRLKFEMQNCFKMDRYKCLSKQKSYSN